MPIVRWLKIRCNDNSSVGRAANKLLLEAFGWQLVYFDGTFVSSFTARQHFANITCLKIEFNNAAEHLLPTINSRRLKYMYLLDIPARFSWKYFCGGQNDSDTIVFSSLTSLCLRFKDDCFEYHTDMMVDCIEIDAEDSAADNTPYRVEFPKLESLFVRDSIEDSILGCTYVFPTELESLNVFNSLETFGLLKQSGVKTVTRIVAEFYQITSDEENEFYEYTNWAYRTGNQSRDKYLSVHNCGFKFNWERMEWSGVTQLQITECNMQTFKAILFYSPRLEVLQVRILVLEGETDKPYAIGSEFVGNSSFSAISPSESLSRICVQEIHDIEKTLDHAMLLFQTMIQRFEHLEKIGVPRRLISSIAQYVERNKADYPHLEGIKVVDFINY
ncbi:hypothetical protein LPJ53_000588 [Coemansia erecta]|uniref:Uncharacterized protein n=1 Tax=Coemansia erecta TaxID=147472 RepID=A0A9W8CTQ4_9FUNG|nr:hypothetical protein LPJ53_000588 [Coemansia erecta]